MHALTVFYVCVQVLLWSLQKTRPLWAVSLKDSQEQQESSRPSGQPSQLFNPPLAHCVSVSSCGNLFACAAEDGRLHLMRVGAGSRLEHQRALQAHSQGASQAHFINFLSHPYWLVSGGNDGLVALWDLSAQGLPPEAKANHNSQPTASRRRARGKPKARARPQERQAEAVGQREEEAESTGAGVCAGAGESVCAGAESVCGKSSGSEENTGPVLSFTHGDKVNWVCPALLQGKPSVVVADQSSDLYVYPLTAL